MMEYNDGGLKEEGGSVDPVSGNEVPPGALAEEVRDDIPAQLSEGEFVFPADVVRYIGLEKLMMMRQQAKEGLMRMDEMGQMSNADEATIEGEPPASYFDIPEMEVPQAALVLEMNQGGSVNKSYKTFEQLMGFQGGTPEQTGYDIVEYVNENGRKILVVEVDGVPTNEVPEGFSRGEVVTEDGNPVGSSDAEAAAPQQQQPQQPQRPQPQPDNNDDDPPMRPEDGGTGAVIVTGGYHNAKGGTIEGGTRWGMERNLNGGVTLKNSQYGEVTLSPEEAAQLQLGSGKGGFGNNIKDAFANPMGNKDRQIGILSTGSATDPAKGNEVHKALVERAELQKAGKEFVESQRQGGGVKDLASFITGGGMAGAIADAFKGNKQVSEMEGNIAQILGKTSNQFTPQDYAAVGLALAGKQNTAYGTALGTATGLDSNKFTELQAFINAVQGKDTGKMSGQTAAAKSGKVTSTVTSPTTAPSQSSTAQVGGSFSMAAQMADQGEDDYNPTGGNIFGSTPTQTVAERADEEAAEAEGGSWQDWNSGDDESDNNSGGGTSFGGGSSGYGGGIGTGGGAGESFGSYGGFAKGGLANKKKNSSRKKKKRKGLASK